jgi:FAD synthetase
LQEQAGLIVIGDEILNGFAQESNLLVCTNALAGVNVPLKRVSMIGDDIGEIVEEVQRMSQKYDYVITSGGIGPTHDDVTLKAIAKALDEEIEVSETMVAHLEAIYGVKRDKLDESTLRLAMLPQNSELLFPPKEESQVDVDGRPIWPVLRCDNIFVLPGVPQFFEDKMNLIAKHFIEPRKENYRPVVKRIVLDLEERSMVGTLDGVVDKFKDRVKIGSYPFIGHPDFKAILTVESLPVQGSNPAADADAVEEAVGLLIEQLPPTAVLRVEAMIPGEDNSLTKTKKVIRE